MTTSTSAAVGAQAGAAAIHPDARAALAGAVATLAALGTSELIAGILPGASSLVAAVGQVVIDLQPPGAKDMVVALFGTNDKLALELLVVAVATGIGALLGILSRRRVHARRDGVRGLRSARLPRGPQRPPGQPGDGGRLGGRLRRRRRCGCSAGCSAPGSSPRTASRRSCPTGRDARSCCEPVPWASEPSSPGSPGGSSSNDNASRRPAPGPRSRPRPRRPRPSPRHMDLSPAIADLTPIVMPNDRFYRIDTALLTPIVDTTTWNLRIHGLVDRETTLSWDELIAMPLFEQYTTIACVSNEVGGKLVGNAKWTGVRLRDVLALAGVQASATQLVGRSIDGWTAGMPMDWVMDPSREPMIAVKMNDEALPPIHGYPARLIVPGLYGYVSATKWLTELEVTTWEAFDGYWVPLGWSKTGPILTQTRIDTPKTGAQVSGHIPIAGVAWAPDRGVAKVEVSIDDVWQEARLSSPISDATWVQWVVEWDVTPGDHTIMVRTTDRTGKTQTDVPSPPAPDGARGWDASHVRGA